MDNEEIRKLLQELKESSDESSAVRSKVVKIHVDTPAEAERRRRVREKEKAREEKRLAEERAKAEAEEEARRLEAEKAALEVVEEAKRQAKAGFASDLEEDIQSGSLTGQDQDEGGEDIDDLELSWNYEKPELKSGFARDEDFDIGVGKHESGGTAADGSDAHDGGASPDGGSESRTGRTLRRGRGAGTYSGSGRDQDDDFDSDRGGFISEDDGDAERESVTGLPGLFGALTDRVVSFAGGIRRSVKEDLLKGRGSDEADEDVDEDFDSDGAQEENIADQEDDGASAVRTGHGASAGRTDDGVSAGITDDEASAGKDMVSRTSGNLREGLEEIAHYYDGDEPDYDRPFEYGPGNGSRSESGSLNESRSESGPLNESRSESGPLNESRSESGPLNESRSESGPLNESRSESGSLNGYRSESGPGNGSRRESGPLNESRSEDGSLNRPLSESSPEKKPQREYGPDEEWKRRMEEAPNKRSRFARLRRELTELRESRPKKEKKPGQKWSLRKDKGSDKDQAKTQVPETGANVTPSVYDDSQSLSAAADDGAVSAAKAEAVSAADKDEAMQAGKPSAEPSLEEESPAEHSTVWPSLTAASHEAISTEEESPAAPVARSIEIIDLNESQNNKDAEVIPLIGDTGALPDPSELKKAAREKSAGRQKAFSLKNLRWGKKNRSSKVHTGKPAQKRGASSAEPDASERGVSATEPVTSKSSESAAGSGTSKSSKSAAGSGTSKKSTSPGFFARHGRLLIIAAVAIAAAAAVAAGVVFMLRQADNTRHAVIEADEGLTVRVLEQPEEFTDQGDIKIRVKAPETIQSITVNSENVVIEQGRSVDFTYHASTGTLDIMAVSTDKVRSAKVILAYIDSQPPAVTIREEDGKITLNAEDTESGVDAIYIGTFDGLTQIPQYRKYSEPLDADPDKEITYYACDQAGNKTAPVTVALTPAESIAFSRDYYGMYPGSTQQVSLVTTPANAFVNNLVLEAEDPKVVLIEGGTQLRGMAEGDTKITATADGIPGVMASVSVSSQRKVKISAIGDCTLGTDESFSQNTSFNAFEALYGDSYFFEKVKGILSSDDSTFANFEGTLTTSTEREAKQFAFKGDPSYTQILLDGSVDTVNLANNHSKDYGIQSQTDTEHALEEAGIEWCMGDHIAYRDLNGVRTAYIGIYALENGLETLPQVKSTISEAKEKGADLIIVEFHWGAELVEQLDEYQKELAHTAVDEGANLVLGSHAHVLQAIEKYNGAYIVYGLGNFCFGGSSNPTSYDTMIWQQTFTFTADGLEPNDDIAIIPCQVSGDLSINNYQPVPVSGDAAAAIMQKIDSLSAEFGQSYSAYMVDGTLWSE